MGSATLSAEADCSTLVPPTNTKTLSPNRIGAWPVGPAGFEPATVRL